MDTLLDYPYITFYKNHVKMCLKYDPSGFGGTLFVHFSIIALFAFHNKNYWDLIIKQSL